MTAASKAVGSATGAKKTLTTSVSSPPPTTAPSPIQPPVAEKPELPNYAHRRNPRAIAVTGTGGTSITSLRGRSKAGVRGLAITGNQGIAQTDDYGLSICGDEGAALVGLFGCGMAGRGGLISFRYWSGTEYAYVSRKTETAEDFMPNKFYRLRAPYLMSRYQLHLQTSTTLISVVPISDIEEVEDREILQLFPNVLEYLNTIRKR